MSRTTTDSRRPRRAADEAVRYRVLPSAEGDFYFACDASGRLIETGWLALRKALPRTWRLDPRLRSDLAAKLKRALSGQEEDFSAEPLPPTSAFFGACRRAAQRVPGGGTLSYAQLAKAAGSPNGARAAGQAMRRNPTPIVVPCHRVIGADGSLYGFAGATGAGGRELGLKERLLARERRAAQEGVR